MSLKDEWKLGKCLLNYTCFFNKSKTLSDIKQNLVKVNSILFFYFYIKLIYVYKILNKFLKSYPMIKHAPSGYYIIIN